MARFGFIGGTYTSQSVNADCQRCMNWYLENMESGAAKSAAVLYPVEGKQLFCALPDTPVRAQIDINGRSFAVSGARLYEIFADGTYQDRGGVGNDGLPASLAASDLEIMIVSAGAGYLLTLATNAFAGIVGLLGPVSQCAFSDGYFIALLANSRRFQISGLEDGNAWDALDVAYVSEFADNVVGLVVDHREIIMLGSKASVVYANTGNPDFPFEPIPGAYIEQGAASVFGQRKIDNTVLWVGADERGAGIGWRLQGYTPVRITTHAIELAWQSYSKISDVVTYAYQNQGHGFWVVYFPSANNGIGATWVFDTATNSWHERGRWDTGAAVYSADEAWTHVFSFGKHLVGDWASGNIYQTSIYFSDDNGAAIRRLRRAPHISSEQEWIQHHRLQLDLESGLGLQVGQGSDPIIMERHSDDGGHTWSTERQMSAGKAGQYKRRAILRRLGRSRDRVYEISTSDPIPWRLIDAYLKATPGYAPTERLTSQIQKGA